MTQSERVALISRVPEVAKVFDELDAAMDALKGLYAVSPQPCFLNMDFRRRWEKAITHAGNILDISHEPDHGEHPKPAGKVAGGKCKTIGGIDDVKQWG